MRTNAVAVDVAFAAGSEALNREFLERLAMVSTGLPLYTVAEFQPSHGEWIPWHVHRGLQDNLEAIRAALQGKTVQTSAVVLRGHKPLRPMKLVALRIGARKISLYDHRLQSIPFSAAGIPELVKHGTWRVKTFVRGQLAAGGRTRRWLHRLTHPRDAEIPFLARRAQLAGSIAGRVRGRRPEYPMRGVSPLLPGVSVVIPSRDGKELLQQLFSTLLPQMTEGEVIVSDNGSNDDTQAWLAAQHPSVRVIHTVSALSFSRAVNLGILAARYSHVFLLNNDMLLEPGCMVALIQAFHSIPQLFCATAQIFFPAGMRREETGKAVWRRANALDFPLRCDDPIAGEDHTWVLYGSGGCSLFDTAKLQAIGGVAEIYEPAYVEDLDFGYRAWKLGWPTVYCAHARVEHRHRATTSRFYSSQQLQFFVERNYLRFLIHAIGSKPLFAELWQEALRRLQRLATAGDAASLDALRGVPTIAGISPAAQGLLDEPSILALSAGDVAVFPGRGRTDRPIAIASPYLPYPLSHGGAVRMFHLARETSRHRGQVLISFVAHLEPVPDELLDIFAEVVLVRRHGSHYRRNTELPDTVEEFRSVAFDAALRLTVAKWRPQLVQLEFTQMAQYADACLPAKTILVEHDITFDLQRQLLADSSDSLRRIEHTKQLGRWETFEQSAWRKVDRVVVMSEKDRAIAGSRAVVLPNGVDTSHFRPAEEPGDLRSILFIGSFAHLPNLLGLAWFLREVWPRLGNMFELHVIAGMRHQYYLDFYRDTAVLDLTSPNIEIDGFVSDVRPAYRRAGIVIAPLVASAGTNIKVLEAMSMGKCIVSTPAGINGLDLVDEQDVLVESDGESFARAIERLVEDCALRERLEKQSRVNAVSRYDWHSVSALQSRLYEDVEG